MSKYKGYVTVPSLISFPKITVEGNNRFALKCKTPRVRIDKMTRKQCVDNIRDMWCTFLV
ncbi:ATV_HP_G0062970.mRNA.1.CDS.1 [Saccharomyces cerevisiae]|nr:ATV_HP_G0062970.mRNA.1.CDS.1 [Saccharomyces cerevisiae]CAI6998999.1 ATV_HP_G0062970.mRNA.1.CDS.1 [Saccharomyces cerevisiae]